MFQELASDSEETGWETYEYLQGEIRVDGAADDDDASSLEDDDDEKKQSPLELFIAVSSLIDGGECGELILFDGVLRGVGRSVEIEFFNLDILLWFKSIKNAGECSLLNPLSHQLTFIFTSSIFKLME